MQYRKIGNTYMVRIDAGEDLTGRIRELCGKEAIRLARVEAIGAADRAVIGVYDTARQEYCTENIDDFMEIASLNGNITTMDGETYIHLHTILADRRHAFHGGHVIEMRIGATCEMFVTVLEGEVNRTKDKDLGINLWSL